MHIMLVTRSQRRYTPCCSDGRCYHHHHHHHHYGLRRYRHGPVAFLSQRSSSALVVLPSVLRQPERSCVAKPESCEHRDEAPGRRNLKGRSCTSSISCISSISSTSSIAWTVRICRCTSHNVYHHGTAVGRHRGPGALWACLHRRLRRFAVRRTVRPVCCRWRALGAVG